MSAVPATRPIVQTRPSLRVVTRSRADVMRAILTRCAVFGFVALATSAGTSLSGHVMVEKARRDGIRAAERAREARSAEAVLRQKVNNLTSLFSVQEWALTHGFQAPDALNQPSRKNLVAVNH
jgi:hypothetical protein